MLSWNVFDTVCVMVFLISPGLGWNLVVKWGSESWTTKAPEDVPAYPWGEVRLPQGISSLRNLQTLQAIYAGGGIAKELCNYVNFVWHEDSVFPCLETFSPPQLLQILELTGRLLEITVWLASMENLSQLRMRCSHLSENPTTILQFLPDLKYLLTGHAYKGVSIALSHPLPPWLCCSVTRLIFIIKLLLINVFRIRPIIEPKKLLFYGSLAMS